MFLLFNVHSAEYHPYLTNQMWPALRDYFQHKTPTCFDPYCLGSCHLPYVDLEFYNKCIAQGQKGQEAAPPYQVQNRVQGVFPHKPHPQPVAEILEESGFLTDIPEAVSIITSSISSPNTSHEDLTLKEVKPVLNESTIAVDTDQEEEWKIAKTKRRKKPTNTAVLPNPAQQKTPQKKDSGPAAAAPCGSNKPKPKPKPKNQNQVPIKKEFNLNSALAALNESEGYKPPKKVEPEQSQEQEPYIFINGIPTLSLYEWLITFIEKLCGEKPRENDVLALMKALTENQKIYAFNADGAYQKLFNLLKDNESYGPRYWLYSLFKVYVKHSPAFYLWPLTGACNWSLQAKHHDMTYKLLARIDLTKMESDATILPILVDEIQSNNVRFKAFMEKFKTDTLNVLKIKQFLKFPTQNIPIDSLLQLYIKEAPCVEYFIAHIAGTFFKYLETGQTNFLQIIERDTAHECWNTVKIQSNWINELFKIVTALDDDKSAEISLYCKDNFLKIVQCYPKFIRYLILNIESLEELKALFLVPEDSLERLEIGTKCLGYINKGFAAGVFTPNDVLEK